MTGCRECKSPAMFAIDNGTDVAYACIEHRFDVQDSMILGYEDVSVYVVEDTP